MLKKMTPRFPDYNWYCVVCHECLSDQAGFNDNKFTWTCTHCKYRNSISKDNLRKPYAYLKDQSITNRFIALYYGLDNVYTTKNDTKYNRFPRKKSTFAFEITFL